MERVLVILMEPAPPPQRRWLSRRLPSGCRVVLLSFLTSAEGRAFADFLREGGRCRVQLCEAQRHHRPAARRTRSRWIRFLSEWPAKIRRKGLDFHAMFHWEGLPVWWLSPLSQQNIFLHDGLEKAVWVEQIRMFLQDHGPSGGSGKYGRAYIVSSDPAFRSVALDFLRRRGIPACGVGSVSGWTRRWRDLGIGFFFRGAKHFVGQLFWWAVLRLLCRRPAAMFPPAAKRRLAWVSYFPGVLDPEGPLPRDRYAAGAPARLAREGVPVCFVATVTHSLRIGRYWNEQMRGFVRACPGPLGMRFCALEQYLRLSDILRSWGRLDWIFRYFFLERSRIFRESFQQGGIDLFPFLRPQFRETFWGGEISRILCRAVAFRRFLREERPTEIVSLFEGTGWERALWHVAAGERLPFVGIQTGFFSSFFLPPAFCPRGRRDGIRLPVRILLHGRYSRRLLRSYGYPASRLQITGSPAHDEIPADPPPAESGGIGVVGSILPKDTAWILRHVWEAAQGRKDWRIWVRCHPVSGKPWRKDDPRIREAPSAAEMIQRCQVVIAAESTLAAEAAVRGRIPVLLFRPNRIHPGPFWERPRLACWAQDAVELRRQVERALRMSSRRPMRLCAPMRRFGRDLFGPLDGRAAERVFRAIQTI